MFFRIFFPKLLEGGFLSRRQAYIFKSNLKNVKFSRTYEDLFQEKK
jgi:hypothetical protein